MKVFDTLSMGFIERAIECEAIAKDAIPMLKQAYEEMNLSGLRTVGYKIRSLDFPKRSHAGFVLSLERVAHFTRLNVEILEWQADALNRLVDTGKNLISAVYDGNLDEITDVANMVLGEIMTTQGFGQSVLEFIEEAQPILDEVMYDN